MTYRYNNPLRHTMGALAVTAAVAALSPPAVVAADVRTIEIRATEFSFKPNQIDVEKGETVELKLINQGSLSHNLHLKGVPVETETVQGGSSDTVRFTPKSDGTLKFFCNVPGHKDAGMTGHITVD